MPANNADVLDETTNMAVVRLAGRRFPGLVLQGDTLANILGELWELEDQLLPGPTENAARETLGDLVQRFRTYLVHYEDVLGRNSYDLPYELRPEAQERLTGRE